MRIALSLIIILCCTAAGCLKAYQYSLRYSLLKRLLNAMRMLESRMLCSMEPLPDLLMRCSIEEDFPEQEFFGLTAQNFLRGTHTLQQCWKNALESCYGAGPLTNRDLELFCQLGKELGTTDMQGQQAAFAQLYRQAELQLEEAHLEKSSKEKLVRGIGIYIGLLIPLILF